MKKHYEEFMDNFEHLMILGFIALPIHILLIQVVIAFFILTFTLMSVSAIIRFKLQGWPKGNLRLIKSSVNLYDELVGAVHEALR